MKDKHIRLRILPSGEVKAEVLGIGGPKCIDYIPILERLLDAETIDSARTSEYYLTEEIVAATQTQAIKQN